ncbi:MAG TPA: hypothetical protein VHR39_15905 [Propionibacteriaceae bacterium]|jgi:hypothetical protein|nr:hypothetical protein [Propionibacteriaceae bacterium]
MSWLRERVESKTGHTVSLPPGNESWLPSVLAQVVPDVVSALTYAVIDERDQPKGQLSFVLSDWPRLDDLGRVRHRHDQLVEVVVPEDKWQAMLAKRRIPEVLRDRPPRIGDAFGVMLERRNARQLLHPIGPVVDVTADARDAARAAFYGAVASPLDPSVVPDVVDEHEEERVGPVPEPEEWRAHVVRRTQ